MIIGSPEHKAQFVQDLLTSYQENIWKDEIQLAKVEENRDSKREEIAAIELKIENKGFKTANEGKKAKFIAERELAHIEKEIGVYQNAINNTWPARMEMVIDYAKRQGIRIE